MTQQQMIDLEDPSEEISLECDEAVDILLVDDRPEKALALESILTDLKQNIIKAHSGNEALRLLLKKDFAVILLDVNMPGMDGFETASLIRQRKRSESTPIIFVTAIDGSARFMEKGYSLGAVDYIYLPIVPDVLKTKVSVFVELFKKNLQVKKLNEDLKRHAEQLESRVRERTKELTQANEELKKLNRIKSDFTSMVTHELRTPLGAIKEGINLVLDGIDGPITEAQKDTLGISKENVDRLDRLIQNVLDFSKLETGQVRMFFEMTELNLLSEEIYCLMGIMARKKGLQIHLHTPKAPISAVCDPDKLKQVIINLIHNSIKFTPEGGSVHLRLIPQGDSVRFEVEDSGIGIRPEDHDKIFEMFAQVYPDGIYKSGGAGVGLAVCKLIVQQHRGRIVVESSPGKGAKFSVILPLKQDLP